MMTPTAEAVGFSILGGVMVVWFYVGIGGFFGAIARRGVGLLLPSHVFPFATLFVNLTGSFLLPFFFTLALERWSLDPKVRLAVATGFIGSYTTFSTFAGEIVTLFRQGRILAAVLYALISMGTGLFLSWLGLKSAEVLSKKATEVETENNLEEQKG